MIRRPPRSTPLYSSTASDVYKRQAITRYAPNPAAALKFLEYLASDSAQVYFADGNNEWPVVKTAPVKNPALDALGSFKPDTLPIGQLAANAAQAQRIYDRAGWR